MQPPAPFVDANEDRTRAQVLLFTMLTVGGCLRVWLSIHDDGIYWPDEIYQSIEPAHRLVFGYGLVAWEFLEGARSWTLPGFVALLLKLCALVRLDAPQQYLMAVRLVFSAVGVGTALGCHLLARRLGAAPMYAACGATLFALSGPAIYFAPRAFAETASALPVVLGLALALPRFASRCHRVVGICLLGFAVLLRLQNALFCVAVIVVLLARKQKRESLEAAWIFAGWALLLGGLDRLIFGQWFRSPIVYIYVNGWMGDLPSTGDSDNAYYLVMLMRSMPLVSLSVLVLSVFAAPRVPSLFFLSSVFFFAHCLVPNKSYRYIIPVLPLFFALASLGLQALSVWMSRRVAFWFAGAVVLFAIHSGMKFRSLRFGALGPYEKTQPMVSAYDQNGDLNRLLIAAHKQPDLCGAKIETTELVWSGGYSYLHRRVPLYAESGPARESGRFNYVITNELALGDRIVASSGELSLVRLPNASCSPDPDYDWRLPGADEAHDSLARLAPKPCIPALPFCPF